MKIKEKEILDLIKKHGRGFGGKCIELENPVEYQGKECVKISVLGDSTCIETFWREKGGRPSTMVFLHHLKDEIIDQIYETVKKQYGTKAGDRDYWKEYIALRTACDKDILTLLGMMGGRVSLKSEQPTNEVVVGYYDYGNGMKNVVAHNVYIQTIANGHPVIMVEAVDDEDHTVTSNIDSFHELANITIYEELVKRSRGVEKYGFKWEIIPEFVPGDNDVLVYTMEDGKIYVNHVKKLAYVLESDGTVLKRNL